jgi:hypothetical protein
MLEVTYDKVIPYPVDVVLSQYYDYEHIRHVHPNTLGEYHLVEVRGPVVVYEQVWPRRFLRRARSLVRQELVGPNEIWFHFLRGRYRGIRVHTVLQKHAEGTLVVETYYLRLPGWRWLRELVRRNIIRKVEAIWEEDLKVKVCRGGWPGVPRL